MTTKVIFVHAAALRRKYGRSADRVERALARLVVADRKRGVRTQALRVDDRRAMSHFRTRPFGDVADLPAAKRLVDAVWRALKPNYVVLLDAPDVFPHQSITKGVFVPDDPAVPSDLPYACNAPASDDARDFVAQVRVVGRIPGITGDDDPSALLGALATAANWKAAPRAVFTEAFAIAAPAFRASLALSLERLFGHERGLRVVPPRNHRWTPAALARRLHFIACHGNDGESEFRGQRGQQYPLAHASHYVAGKLRAGTVAAVECCYGAQLYDPRARGSVPPIVNTYLRDGAYAYVGSSTTAHCGSDGTNEEADLICQDFVHHVLEGAPTGRALLAARQEFMRRNPHLDGVHLATLAQFNLFGDPSIRPVERERGLRALPGARADREQLEARARELQAGSFLAAEAGSAELPASTARSLNSALRRLGAGRPEITSHDVRPARPRASAQPHAVDAVHIATAEHGPERKGRRRRITVVAHTLRGKLVALRRLQTV